MEEDLPSKNTNHPNLIFCYINSFLPWLSLKFFLNIFIKKYKIPESSGTHLHKNINYASKVEITIMHRFSSERSHTEKTIGLVIHKGMKQRISWGTRKTIRLDDLSKY